MSSFARLARACGLAVALGLATIISAAPSARGADVIQNGVGPVSLEVNKGRLIRLDRPASAVFVADPGIANIQVKSPRLIYIYGRAVGETTLYAVDGGDAIVASLMVKVDHNLNGLREALQRFVPESRIEVTSVEGALVLSGMAGSASEAEDARNIAARYIGKDEKLLNLLTIKGPSQVHLRVRVAEMSRQIVKQFGINLGATLTSGDFIFSLLTGRPFVAAGQIFQNGEAAAAGLQYRSNDLNLDSAIDALEEEGLISILAEPNLTALSGETASFLAGGEFPIPVAQDEGRVSIEFKQFGVSLSFTPTVLSGERISLLVRPEVSQLSDAGAIQANAFNIPSLTTRRAETTVELASGQSFAIAGLLQNTVNNDLNKFPWLGDIPILGLLFRSTNFQRDETELVIVVTPYLVRPSSDKRVALPNDGFVAPHDVDRILRGKSYREQPRPPREAPVGREGQRLNGPAGFVLE